MKYTIHLDIFRKQISKECSLNKLIYQDKKVVLKVIRNKIEHPSQNKHSKHHRVNMIDLKTESTDQPVLFGRKENDQSVLIWEKSNINLEKVQTENFKKYCKE